MNARKVTELKQGTQESQFKYVFLLVVQFNFNNLIFYGVSAATRQRAGGTCRCRWRLWLAYPIMTSFRCSLRALWPLRALHWMLTIIEYCRRVNATQWRTQIANHVTPARVATPFSIGRPVTSHTSVWRGRRIQNRTGSGHTRSRRSAEWGQVNTRRVTRNGRSLVNMAARRRWPETNRAWSDGIESRDVLIREPRGINAAPIKGMTGYKALGSEKNIKACTQRQNWT